MPERGHVLGRDNDPVRGKPRPSGRGEIARTEQASISVANATSGSSVWSVVSLRRNSPTSPTHPLAWMARKPRAESGTTSGNPFQYRVHDVQPQRATE